MDNDDISCKDAIHQLYHFLDGELTESKRKLIGEHLDKCSPCASAFGFELELRRIIIDKTKVVVPKDLIEKIAQSIEHEKNKG